MRLEYIREFIVLAEIGEVSRAAKQLKTTQPTLSKHIKQLEFSLGVPLFNRSSKGLFLNHYGNVFLPYAKIMAEEQDAFLLHLTKKQNEKDHNELTIGFIYSVLLYGGMNLFNRFSQENPDIPLSLQESLSWELERSLCANEFDFVFYNEYGPVNADDPYGRVPILTDTLIAAVPENHLLAKREFVTLEDLTQDPFIMWPKYSLCYSILMPAFRKHNLSPNIVTFSPDSQHIQNFITDGYGISVLLKRRANLQRNPKVTFVELRPHIHIDLNMLYNKDSLSPKAERFLEFMSTHASYFDNNLS